MERKYVAFISYRHAPLDSAVAKMLHSFIEQYNIPRSLRKGDKKLGTVFRDKEELPASSNLSDDICRALDNSEHLIVICSKDTAASPWVTREVEYFLSHHDRAKVFTVLASGEPQDVFPTALTHINNADGTVTDVEPLAVDIRSDSVVGVRKLLRREIIRLYAAILGCPYDSLVMREQRRKRRRAAAIFSVAFAVVLAFSGMLLAKNRQIDLKNSELENANLELENANAELALQKAEVQLRESELLADSAFDAINNGNYITAIENAVEALPSKDNDRPYYAPAEQALFEALGVFDISGVDFRITSTNIHQMTPVSVFAISSDGSMIATIDGYNVVNCFDSTSAKQLWTYQLATDGHVENMQLFPLGSESVIAFSADIIVSFDFKSGEILWSHETEAFSVGHLNPDGSVLAYLSQEFDNNISYYIYNYIFISTDTGEILYSIHIADSSIFGGEDTELPNLIFTEVNDLTSQNGAFSDNGKYFVGSFYEEKNNNTYLLHHYLIDIAAETLEIVHTEDLNAHYSSSKVTHIAFCDDNTSFITVRNNVSTDIAATVSKYDISENALLWRTSSPTDDNYYGSTAAIYDLITDNYVFVARMNCLYIFDAATGELVDSVIAESNIVDIELVGEYSVALLFTDGRYTLGWYNASGIFLTDEYYSSASFNLGSIKAARLYNDGFQRLSIKDNSINALEIGDEADDYGYVALVPADNEQTVIIKRITFFEDIVTHKVIEIFEDGDHLANSSVRRISEDSIAFGQISNWNDGESTYRYAIVDLENSSMTKSILLSEYKLDENLFILPDGSGMIEYSSHGDIVYINSDTGEETVIAKNETILMYEHSDYTFTSGKYLNASAQLYPSGDVLSIQCSNDELVIWTNGTNRTVVPLPEDVIWAVELSTSFSRELFVDDKGHIILSHYDNDGDVIIDAFAIYDIFSENWCRIPLNDLNMSYVYCNVAENSPLMLMADGDNTAYLFDIESGNCITDFPLKLPQNSISHTKFIRNDEYLLVKTNDLRILIYDISTGNIVYSQQISGYYDADIQVFEDVVNNRLYFAETSSPSDDGVCIDTVSWTKLADIPGFLYYDSDSNEVYCYTLENNTFEKCILAFDVPSTAELVAAGIKIISK